MYTSATLKAWFTRALLNQGMLCFNRNALFFPEGLHYVKEKTMLAFKECSEVESAGKEERLILPYLINSVGISALRIGK
jgi:hypothetical protein